MNKIDKRIQKEKLVLEIFDSKKNIYTIFPEINPYLSNFNNQLKIALNDLVNDILGKIYTIFPDLRPKDKFSNAWSILITNTDSLLLLYYAGITSNDFDVQNEAIRLAQVFKNSLAKNIFSDCVLNLDGKIHLVPPNLSNCVPLKPGIRLRYALAHHWVKGASAFEIFLKCMNQKNATDYLKIRELKIVFQAFNESHTSLDKLTITDFLLLNKDHQNFILSDVTLTEILAPDALKTTNLNEIRNNAFNEVNTINEKLIKIHTSLLERKFLHTSELLKSLQLTDFTKRLFREKFRDLTSFFKTGTHKIEKWNSLNKDSIEIWKELNGLNNLPIWWCCEPIEIVELICNKNLKLYAIPPEDLEVISQSWDDASYEKFGNAGLFEVIPVDNAYWDSLDLRFIFEQLQEHPSFKNIVKNRIKIRKGIQEFLELIKSSDSIKFIDLLEQSIDFYDFQSIVVSTIGTSEWHCFPDKIKKDFFNFYAVSLMCKCGYVPLFPEGFYKATAPLLLDAHNERMNSWRARNTGVADTSVSEYLAKHPLAILDFYHLISIDELFDILDYQSYTIDTLNIFKRILPEEFQTKIWYKKLLKSKTYSNFQKLLLQRILKTGAITWTNQWLDLKGTQQEKSTALVLVTLRNTERLKKLYEVLGPKLFLVGINGAIKVLPAKARRDKGYLELIKVLGCDEIPYIAAVMSMTAKDKRPGHKLDDSYYNYLLPKKSGGNRVISSPHIFLKRVQRTILDKLIQPLGAHDCAHGFVVNRSISSNAVIHINNPIVTNSDISNCFPSVKWPLVLGVLRRDLGKKLSPGAISILLDICTSNGGLPIGAPTSPALLNRVLYKSDEILQAAAISMNCNYSRYADDMTFSGDHGAVKLLGITKRTLSQIGLRLDEVKTNIYRKGRRQIVTGLVVNEKVSVSKKIRKRMRAAVHAVELGKDPTWHGEPQSIKSLEGRLAFLHSIDKKQAKKLIDRLHKTSNQ